MGYVKDTLIPGENILYSTRLHAIVLFWPIFFACLLGLAALGSLGASFTDKSSNAGLRLMALVYFLAAAGLAILGVARRKATEMAVTNKRVIIKTGLLSKRTIELLLTKVESVGVEQGIFGRIFGYGSIVVRGTGGTAEPFKRVAHPLEFRHQVHQQIERVQTQEKP